MVSKLVINDNDTLPLSGGSEKMAGLNIIEDVQFYYSSNRYSMVQKCMILIVDHHLVVGVVSNVSVNCSHLATVYPGASGTCTPFNRNYVLCPGPMQRFYEPSLLLFP